MYRTLLFGLAASLLVASNVNAAQSTSPASTMAWELAGASNKCLQLSINQGMRERNDDTQIDNATQKSGAGQPSAGMNAMAEASSDRKTDDDRYDACLKTARNTGKAAYEKYLASPGQSQVIQNDAKAVYNAWLAALPDLSKAATRDSAEVLALRKAWAALHVDEKAG